MHALRNVCTSCGQELKLDWGICPYCNAQVAVRTKGAAPKTGAEVPEFEVTPEEPPPPAAPEKPAAPAAAAPLAPAAGGTAPVTAPIKKPYILVVDDDSSIKRVIKKALKQLPFEVEIDTAGDGAEALEMVEERPPDMVMTDVMMPEMDGFTLCQRLREGLRTAFVPIMMLTADANETNRTKGFLMGTDDYVSKPFSVPDLNARVLRLLRRTYGL
jgi:CheY-like chemotaxis protein